MFVSSEVLSSLHLEVLNASSASAFEKVLEADNCDFLSAAVTAHRHSFIHSVIQPISGCQLIKEKNKNSDFLRESVTFWESTQNWD